MKGVLRFVLYFVFMLVVLAGCKDTKNVRNNVSYVNIDAVTLITDFNNNPMLAKNEHNNKDYAVLGIIDKIDVDGGYFTLAFDNKKLASIYIKCELINSEQKKKLRNFKIGHTVLAKGNIINVNQDGYIFRLDSFETPFSTSVVGMSTDKNKEKKYDYSSKAYGKYVESVSGVKLGMSPNDVMKIIGSPTALLSEEQTMKQFNDAYRKSWFYKKHAILVMFKNDKVCSIVLLPNTKLVLDGSGLNGRNSMKEFNKKYSAQGTIKQLQNGEYLHLNELNQLKVTLTIFPN